MSLYTIIYPEAGKVEPSGGYVEMLRFQVEQEVEQNLQTAILLARQGYRIRLLPISNIPYKKNPDAFFINEQVSVEFKHNQKPTRSAIDNELRKAQEQADYIVLHVLSRIRKSDLINALTDRVNRSKGIRILWLIWQGKVYRLSRKEVLEKTIRNKIE